MRSVDFVAALWTGPVIEGRDQLATTIGLSYATPAALILTTIWGMRAKEHLPDTGRG